MSTKFYPSKSSLYLHDQALIQLHIKQPCLAVALGAGDLASPQLQQPVELRTQQKQVYGDLCPCMLQESMVKATSTLYQNPTRIDCEVR